MRKRMSNLWDNELYVHDKVTFLPSRRPIYVHRLVDFDSFQSNYFHHARSFGDPTIRHSAFPLRHRQHLPVQIQNARDQGEKNTTLNLSTTNKFSEAEEARIKSFNGQDTFRLHSDVQIVDS